MLGQRIDQRAVAAVSGWTSTRKPNSAAVYSGAVAGPMQAMIVRACNAGDADQVSHRRAGGETASSS